MPAVSLVVCAHGQIDLLQRLLLRSQSCYDDLVVVHDGSADGDDDDPTCEHRRPLVGVDYSGYHPQSPPPAEYSKGNSSPRPESIQALVERHRGRYFEGARCFEQEPHWPFAWSQAKNDWILRLDADEFPSPELVAWLLEFRVSREPEPDISGYTCTWPLWNGKRVTSSRWPAGRIFLINRRHVRFFGMVEQSPVADGRFAALSLVLNHQPKRTAYGVRNVLLRRQSYYWRSVISRSLIGKPTDLPRWRWNVAEWPEPWKSIRHHPLKYGLSALIRYPFYQFASMIQAGVIPNLSASLNPGLHHFMLGLRVRAENRRRRLRTP